VILEEKNDIYLIFPGEGETFWAYDPIDVRKINSHRPKIKAPLKDWWDTTAPGEWTTSFVDKSRKAIVIRDKALFLLFKLAWTGKEEIQKPIVADAAFYYCPYVPLQTTPKQ
jgi:hypothetical protein